MTPASCFPLSLTFLIRTFAALEGGEIASVSALLFCENS